MGINPQVLVADNGHMKYNVIKYAYENNIRLLIPYREKAANPNLKILNKVMK